MQDECCKKMVFFQSFHVFYMIFAGLTDKVDGFVRLAYTYTSVESALDSGAAPLCGGVRKVRASQGGIPANGRPGRPEGKCNRKIPPRFAVRMERRGKSSPGCGQPHCHVNPIRSNANWDNAAARRVPKGGWSRAATRGQERSSSTTEPGLQAPSLCACKSRPPCVGRSFCMSARICFCQKPAPKPDRRLLGG